MQFISSLFFIATWFYFFCKIVEHAHRKVLVRGILGFCSIFVIYTGAFYLERNIRPKTERNWVTLNSFEFSREYSLKEKESIESMVFADVTNKWQQQFLNLTAKQRDLIKRILFNKASGENSEEIPNWTIIYASSLDKYISSKFEMYIDLIKSYRTTSNYQELEIYELKILDLIKKNDYEKIDRWYTAFIVAAFNEIFLTAEFHNATVRFANDELKINLDEIKAVQTFALNHYNRRLLAVKVPMDKSFGTSTELEICNNKDSDLEWVKFTVHGNEKGRSTKYVISDFELNSEKIFETNRPSEIEKNGHQLASSHATVPEDNTTEMKIEKIGGFSSNPMEQSESFISSYYIMAPGECEKIAIGGDAKFKAISDHMKATASIENFEAEILEAHWEDGTHWKAANKFSKKCSRCILQEDILKHFLGFFQKFNNSIEREKDRKKLHKLLNPY